jgi:hypothetical protein
MVSAGTRAHGIAWAGLATGPGAWSISTMLNYVLVPVSCTEQTRLVPIVAVVLILVALAGGRLSWRALQASPRGIGGGRSDAAERFIARLGAAAAVLFAAVILMQGLAGFFYNGCER